MWLWSDSQPKLNSLYYYAMKVLRIQLTYIILWKSFTTLSARKRVYKYISFVRGRESEPVQDDFF